MGNPANEIKFTPRPLKVGEEWYLVATWPDGREEHITGFKTEMDALNWLGRPEQLEWLRARGFTL
jgi:hypothetical protein